jgi:peptide/nickel transport system substrate-binding protein
VRAYDLNRRRVLQAGVAGALAMVTARRPARAAAMPFTVVLESEVVIVDPHMTTAAITRTFGYHIFDTLFSMDSRGRMHPQMVGEYTTSTDGLSWSFTLRDGLKWHDGGDVTAADCVTSLQRWGKQDSLGRMLLAATNAITAVDPRRFTITLHQPFPLMLDVLGKPNAPVPFMMPARIMQAAGAGRITEIIGSGPFVFQRDQWRPGDTMVLSRNDTYAPRIEPSDFLAGGKVVHVDRVVLRVMPDQATGANALIAGEIDYMQFLPFDLLGPLAEADGVKLLELGGLDMYQGNFRLNHASGPFADPAVRRVLWKLVNQDDILTAIGIPDRFRLKTCPSYFMCGTPFETDAGAEAARFSVADAKAELARTQYKGEPVIMLEVAQSISQTAGNILAQNMKDAGFTVEEQTMDWGTVLARRAKRDGWSLFPVYSNGADMASPLTHFYITNNCGDYPGWSCDSDETALLAAFVKASGPEDRKGIAAKIQAAAYESVPSVMWGQFAIPVGYRTRVRNLIPSAFPMLWNVEIAA